jgi:TP901 family phage tail tape measure protein
MARMMSQKSKVGALASVGKGSEQFEALRQQAIKLGADTSFSASQAAQGMEYLAQAGFDANKIMASMPGLLDAAKASGTDLGETAKVVGQMLNSFGLEAAQTGRVADILTSAANRSAVDLVSLGESMKYVGPIAKSLNGSLEVTTAMAGLLGDVGIRGSEAGTALRALYNRMASPPKAAEEAMQAIGLKAVDAQGNLQTARTDILVETVVEKNPDVRHMIAHSAPLPIPHDLDAFVYVAAVKA